MGSYLNFGDEESGLIFAINNGDSKKIEKILSESDKTNPLIVAVIQNGLMGKLLELSESFSLGQKKSTHLALSTATSTAYSGAA